MCSSHLPLLSLCQCCHRDEGKQSKGTSVIQKPVSRVCGSNRSAGDTRDPAFKTGQRISNDWWIKVMQSLTHMNEVLYRCFHGLQGWSPPHTHTHWEDLSQCLLQNIENEWPYFQFVEFHAVLQHFAMFFQISFHSTRFEICTDIGPLTNYGAPPHPSISALHCARQERMTWQQDALQTDEGKWFLIPQEYFHRGNKKHLSLGFDP